MFIHESGLGVNQLRQAIQPAAEQRQHSGRVVLGRAAGLEKDIDAGAQPFYGTRVPRNDVVESRAGIAAVRICAVRHEKLHHRASIPPSPVSPELAAPIISWRRHSCLPRRDSSRRLARKSEPPPHPSINPYSCNLSHANASQCRTHKSYSTMH
jgi:hypothetical protein